MTVGMSARTVVKANRGINVEKYDRFLKIKTIKRRKQKKKQKKKKEKKRKTLQNCKGPTWRQRFITTIKSDLFQSSGHC